MKSRKRDILKLDKSFFKVASLGQESDEKLYWQTKSPKERMLASEIMRQICYGYDPTTQRLQRVLSIAKIRGFKD